MKLKIYYPWSETPAGGSFFVPTLDVYKTKQAGLTEALRLKIKGVARFGMLGGRHGVLFTRRS
jgi:hypothetical protein